MRKVTYEIVESPVAGDPLYLLREQEARIAEAEASGQFDWRELLHAHIQQAIQTPPSYARSALPFFHDVLEDADAFEPTDGQIRNLLDELAKGGIEVRHFRVNEKGELEEI